MRNFVVGLAAVAAIVFLASCGTNSTGSISTSGSSSGSGGSQSSNKNQYVYIAETTQDSNYIPHGAIEAFALNQSSGAITALAGSPFSTNYSTSGDMAISPNNDFAYLVAQQYGQTCCIGPTSVLVYALDPKSGIPTQKQSLVLAGTSPQFYVKMDPAGTFLYVSPWNNDDTGIGQFAVQSDGTLNFIGVQTASSSDGTAIAPNGKFLFTHTDGAAVGGWPGTSACGPVVTNIWEYNIDSMGALTQVSGSPFTFQRQECQVGHENDNLLMKVDPTNSRLFVIDQANGLIDVFSIDATSGALTLLPGNASGFFSSAAFDPVTDFLYVGSINGFYGFTASGSTTTGNLPALGSMPITIPAQPNDPQTGSTTIGIDATGTYLFSNENGYTSAFSCCGPDGLVEFQINGGSGALTQLTVSPATLAGTASRIRVATPQ